MSSSNMPTQLDNGRYQLGQLIGRGGMAQVHVALDTRLGRTVAIKIMRTDFANDEIFLARFRREAHAVAQMNNPNIVNIYDSGEESILLENGQTERVPYLVMEYVKGQTLRDIIKANGPLNQRDAEHVMIGVLSALEYSHRMGIIHRDIKPGNIMISEQGVVKVMDFGIARALDDSATTMTQSQGVVGTAQYLSPEQARGESVDMRSDIYSAGCVLYEMLTGRPPFTGDSAVAIAYQHVSEVAPKPSSLVPGLSPMWDSICGKAMAKDRQNRYATAAEFKQDILTYMNGGMPVAAAFNPLSDLTQNKNKRDAENAKNTVAYTSPVTNPGPPTQTFNPATGQFEAIDPANTQSRSQQRAAVVKKRRKKHVIVACIIIGVLLVAGLVGGFVWAQNNRVTMVTVPTFNESTTQARAKQKLESVGLVLEAKTDTNSTLPEGTFTKQSPKGGSSVEEGSKVTVWFSAGPKSIKVPDVTGYSQSEARETLTQAGFEVNDTVQTEDSSTIPKDSVTRTDPAANSMANRGSTIQLYVSSGMTKIPAGIVGASKTDAVAKLQESGIAITIESEYSDTVPEGTVIRVSPDSGTSVGQMSSATIWVSNGPEPVTVPSVIGMDTASAKSQLESAGFKVVVNGSSDSGARVTAMTPGAGESVKKGDTITLTSEKPSSSSPSPSSSSSESDKNGDNGSSNSSSHADQQNRP